MKKYQVHEIFYSLQGEGAWTGQPMVFVRFWGCNMKCSFCDTPQRGENKREMTAPEIWNEIEKLRPKGESIPVCFTGGEPLLQLDKELLREASMYESLNSFHLETNGSIALRPELIRHFKWITVSPKERVDEEIVMIYAHEIRQLYSKEREHEILAFVKPFYPNALLYVSPINGIECIDTGRLNEAIDFCLRHPRFMLNTQMHKLWRIK
uniref:Putative radical SAM superfamily protein n=1 Tax=viral metagenome TaxID=1070528 RepID=A0A6M3ISC6_9ZZZZ